MIFETVPVGLYGVNCYVLASGKNKKAIIIDPGDEPHKIKNILTKHKLEAGLVINTHGHADHIGADDAFGVCVYIHKRDSGFLDNPDLNLSQFLGQPLRIASKQCIVQDEEEIRLDEINLRILHTPGHTPGGICLLLKAPQDNILFSGDTLFYQGIGRTDFPKASSEQLKKSINEKLFVLDNHIEVYPGHGPSTTIGQEKQSNPFFQ